MTASLTLSLYVYVLQEWYDHSAIERPFNTTIPTKKYAHQNRENKNEHVNEGRVLKKAAPRPRSDVDNEVLIVRAQSSRFGCLHRRYQI